MAFPSENEYWFGKPTYTPGGDVQSKEYAIWYIEPDDIPGNWKFVFLDCCYCAVDETFANAFNIYSTSVNRAFLGWRAEVYGGPSLDFSEHFFPEVEDQIHSNNIRDAAVWAAAQVDGDQSTPIRFYGDRTYDGRLY
ncbi:MAG: hypothetical protein IKZ19_01635 [Clostridia bacterium]|nr:hypothetical protein [Clostridia bacterium]